ncbi:MAG: bacterio-opsin activator domain-containing protein [Haloarculaceae archaeon]
MSAGAEDGYLESVTVTDDDSPTGRGPAARAFATGTVQVAAVGDPAFEPWRAAAQARDVAAVAAVPLGHGETVYGVLVVYAARADAFSEREQAAFRVLGDTVGFVVNAIKHRNLLFADEVAALEIAVPTSSTVLGPTAAALDCELTLDGYLARGEAWLGYFDVEGVSAAAVADALADLPAVRAARVVTDESDRRRVEVTLARAPLFEVVDTVGGTIERLVVTPGELRVVVEVAAATDVRETVELITARLAGATLVARREVDRRPTGPGAPEGIVGELTERQRDALEVAYRSGYYEWPRESTAEEVAASLGVASSTLHAHLRKAQRRLLGALLDASTDADR